jgi:predicted transcriptional regulator
MSNKEAVIELIKRLPENISLTVIAEEVRFIAAIQEGFEEIDLGKGVPVETVEKMMASWTIE